MSERIGQQVDLCPKLLCFPNSSSTPHTVPNFRAAYQELHRLFSFCSRPLPSTGCFQRRSSRVLWSSTGFRAWGYWSPWTSSLPSPARSPNQRCCAGDRLCRRSNNLSRQRATSRSGERANNESNWAKGGEALGFACPQGAILGTVASEQNINMPSAAFDITKIGWALISTTARDHTWPGNTAREEIFGEFSAMACDSQCSCCCGQQLPALSCIAEPECAVVSEQQRVSACSGSTATSTKERRLSTTESLSTVEKVLGDKHTQGTKTCWIAANRRPWTADWEQSRECAVTSGSNHPRGLVIFVSARSKRFGNFKAAHQFRIERLHK